MWKINRSKNIKLAANIFIILCVTAFNVFAAVQSSSYILLKAYYQYGLNEEVGSGCKELMQGAADDDAAEVRRVLEIWQSGNTKSIRSSLVDAFGDDAKREFEDFVGTYSKAESDADEAYLKRLTKDIVLQLKVSDYKELRAYAAKEIIDSSLSGASGFLGNIETWIELGVMGLDRPPLDAWLLRDIRDTEKSEPVIKEQRSLRGAEAPAGTFQGSGMDDVNPLEALSRIRDDRRAKSLKDAEAGMAMIAAERQAAEQEYAADKMAKARAEADAQVAQAKKLAAADTEAIEQRKHSWGNRLKNIVSTTASVAGGAFMGHIGAEAGRQAVNAVFD